MCAGHNAQQRDAVGGDEPRDVDLLQDSVNWTSSKFHDKPIIFCQMSWETWFSYVFLVFVVLVQSVLSDFLVPRERPRYGRISRERVFQW